MVSSEPIWPSAPVTRACRICIARPDADPPYGWRRSPCDRPPRRHQPRGAPGQAPAGAGPPPHGFVQRRRRRRPTGCNGGAAAAIGEGMPAVRTACRRRARRIGRAKPAGAWLKRGMMPVHNAEIAAIFDQTAELLEIKGENPFRTRAYRRAARVVEALPQSVTSLLKAGKDLSDLPGIGKDLAGKIAEIAGTGRVDLLEGLKSGGPEPPRATPAPPGPP